MEQLATGRNTGLDVLRALACLAVFVVHSVPGPLAQSGWVGVQVFFVLSGFLITRSLLSAQRRGLPAGQQMRRFFASRALRILPPLLIFLLIAVPLTRALGNGSDAGWPYALGFVHNLWVMSAAHYPTPYFNNLWSLSVEEQFYLLYPWLIVYAPRRRVAVMVGAVLLAPAIRYGIGELASAMPQWFTTMRAQAPGATPRDLVVYVFGFSHLDAFALGGLLALGGPALLTRYRQGWQLLLATAMLLALGGLLTGQRDGLFYRAFLGQAGNGQHLWGYTALNLWACMLIAYAASQAPRWKLSQGLAWFGRISYEFYIVHFPVMALCLRALGNRPPPPLAVWIAVQLVACLLVAWLLHQLSNRLTLWPKSWLTSPPDPALPSRYSSV